MRVGIIGAVTGQADYAHLGSRINQGFRGRKAFLCSPNTNIYEYSLGSLSGSQRMCLECLRWFQVPPGCESFESFVFSFAARTTRLSSCGSRWKPLTGAPTRGPPRWGSQSAHGRGETTDGSTQGRHEPLRTARQTVDAERLRVRERDFVVRIPRIV